MQHRNKIIDKGLNLHERTTDGNFADVGVFLTNIYSQQNFIDVLKQDKDCTHKKSEALILRIFCVGMEKLHKVLSLNCAIATKDAQ